MKLHASGEDYLETILVLQKKLGMVLRRCGPAHGGVKAQRVPCSGFLAGWRLCAPKMDFPGTAAVLSNIKAAVPYALDKGVTTTR